MLWFIYFAFVLLTIFMSTVFKNKQHSYKKKIYISLISLALFFLIAVFLIPPIAATPLLEPLKFKLLGIVPLFFILFFNLSIVLLLSALPTIYFFVFKKASLKLLTNNPNDSINTRNESKIKNYLNKFEIGFTVMICLASFFIFYASTFVLYDQLLRSLN